jgi:hypothetical protein
MKRGSIELARSICTEIKGIADDGLDDIKWGSVDIAEILSAEVINLRVAIIKTLNKNRHLADGENCSLIDLKIALRESGAPWESEDFQMA